MYQRINSCLAIVNLLKNEHEQKQPWKSETLH